MSLMKFAASVVLLAIVMAKAEETKTSSLMSSGESKQNKRLAVYGSNTFNSGFKPISPTYSSYQSLDNYAGNPQLFTSAGSNVYSQSPSYASYFASPSTKYPAYSSYQNSYLHYQQPLAFAASHPAQVSYVQPPSNYAYPHGGQYYAQQVPFNHFPYHATQPINPLIHAQPVASFTNSYHTPANTFYVNPQQIHKNPFYNQHLSSATAYQPHLSAASAYQPVNYQLHVKQSTLPRQIAVSKPVALQAPTSLSTSHIEHSQGAVSYAHVSSGEVKPAPAAHPLSQTPQQVYYHQQPQAFYAGDYSKQSQYAVPIASNYYGKIPAAASTLIPSIAPQKVSVQ